MSCVYGWTMHDGRTDGTGVEHDCAFCLMIKGMAHTLMQDARVQSGRRARSCAPPGQDLNDTQDGPSSNLILRVHPSSRGAGRAKLSRLLLPVHDLETDCTTTQRQHAVSHLTTQSLIVGSSASPTPLTADG